MKGSLCSPFIETAFDAVVLIKTKTVFPDLRKKNTLAEQKSRCSGVVVGPNTVYTAKHCLSMINDEMHVVIVGTDTTYDIERAEFDAKTDLAVLYTTEKISNIKPASVTFRDMPYNEMNAGTLIGYGCARDKRLIHEASYWRPDSDKISSKIFVNGCICHGDSGGGLFDSQGNLVGIITNTMENGREGFAFLLNKSLRLKSK